MQKPFPVAVRILSVLPLFAILVLSSCGKKQPQVLDLSAHYTDKFDPPAAGAKSSGNVGSLNFDGVPFQVGGRVILFGKQKAGDAGKSHADYPDIIGVKVGRSFNELHLLHATEWPDVEGATIARVRLHYADGTSSDLDIGYGIHMRDWQRLQSEEREALTDSNSKVVWRGPGIEKFKSSQRLFKSVLINPFGSKRVNAIDFVSADQIASYTLYAATVADADSSRVVTPPVSQDRPEWNFDGRLHVRVLDPQGNPIEGALIDSSLSVPGAGWATSGAPIHTSAQGTMIVKYPSERTGQIMLKVTKDGWQSVSQWVNTAPVQDGMSKGLEVTFRLKPVD